MLTMLVMSTGCTSGSGPPIIPGPSTPAETTARPASTTHLRFSPGKYLYRYTQTAEIRGSGPTDTLPSQIRTEALIHAVVMAQADSSITVTISFDSILISTEGLIPTQGIIRVNSLDSIVRSTFSRMGAATEVQLADSLCMYGQFASVGRELLLPELSLELETATKKSFTESTAHRSCRAGISIEVATTRDLKTVGRNVGEVTIEERSKIQGAGTLRRDSITVDGTSSTRGRASFTLSNRLPTLIQSETEGQITVTLGTTVTEFRQRSTQEIRFLSIEPNQ